MKSIAFLGDSITLGYGLSNQAARFSTLVCKELDAKEENYGITGTLIANAGVSRDKGISFVERAPLIEKANLAVIFGGTNDYFWSDRPIGAPKGAEDSTEYFEVAVDRLFRFCAEHRPKGTTLIVTPYPHHGVGNYQGAECWNAHNDHDTDTLNLHGHRLCDYVACIAQAAERYDLPLLNLHDNTDFDWHRHTLDGCHPNEAGHRCLAQSIAKAISKR